MTITNVARTRNGQEQDTGRHTVSRTRPVQTAVRVGETVAKAAFHLFSDTK